MSRVGAGWLTNIHLGQVSGELLWIALGQLGVAVGAVVGVRVLTRALSPDAYGELALAMTFVTLGQQVILGPLSGAVLRFYAPASEKGQLRNFFSASRTLYSGALALIVAFGFVLAGASKASGSQPVSLLVLGSVAFAVFSGISALLDSIQNAARQRIIASWHAALGIWLRFLAAAGFVMLLGATSVSAMLGYSAAALLVLLSQYWFFRRYIYSRTAGDRQTPKEGENLLLRNQLLNYAWPFIAWGAFTWLQLSSDRWALQAFRDASAVGLYTVLFQLGYYPMTIVATMVMQLVMPILFARAGDASDAARLSDAQRLNRHLLLGALGFTVLAALGALLLYPLVFTLFAGAEYRSVGYLLPVVVLAGGLFASGQLASISPMAANTTKKMIAPKIVTAVIGVLANIAGAYFFGVTGVVWALVLFGLVYCIWMAYLQLHAKAQWKSVNNHASEHQN